MTEKEYRAHPAVSRSELWRMKDSPEKFKYFKEHPEPPTDALIFGQAFHEMVLQPDAFPSDFIIADTSSRKTKIYKQTAAEFPEQTALLSSELEQLNAMNKKLQNMPFAQKLLSGEHETPFFWVDPLTGEECKCRTDCLVNIGGQDYIVDLKTATNADNEHFQKDAIKYGYHLQAAMYSEGVKRAAGKSCKFVFLVIEKNPPYAINVFQADELFCQYGFDIFRELIGMYHECKASGNWWGYLGKYDMVNGLSLPAWLAKELD